MIVKAKILKKTVEKYQDGGKKKKNTVKKRLSPNSFSSEFDKDGSRTFKVTNEKGKYRYISTSNDVDDRKGTIQSKAKEYTTFGKPTLKITSTGSPYKGDKFFLGKDVVHYEKSLDTTGYAKGRKYFTEVSKKKIPVGINNMYEITERKVGRKAVKPILDKMKKTASTPIKKFKKGGIKKTKK